MSCELRVARDGNDLHCVGAFPGRTCLAVLSLLAPRNAQLATVCERLLFSTISFAVRLAGSRRYGDSRMPTYDYSCRKCGHAFEVFEAISASTRKACPKCARRTAHRMIGAGAGLLFKGSGFYITDYKRAGTKPEAETAPAKSKPAAEAVPAKSESCAGGKAPKDCACAPEKVKKGKTA